MAMTVGKKLFLTSAAALVLTLVVGLVSLFGLSAAEGEMQALAKADELRYLVTDMNTSLSEVLSIERAMLARALMKDPAAIEQYNQQLGAVQDQIKHGLEQIAALAETGAERQEIEKLESGFRAITNSYDEFHRAAAACNAKQTTDVFTRTILPLASAAKQNAARLVELAKSRMSGGRAESDATISRTRFITVAIIALSVAVVLIVGFTIRKISGELRKAIVALAEGARQTAGAAGQVSSSSQTVAQSASEQAASIQETSASAEEVSASARRNSSISQEMASEMQEALRIVGTVNDAIQNMSAAVAEINKSSDAISKIKVIEEIAFQTNILALNAAVEAARAGEAGMGFAVVADEVRSLAQRCAGAAKDITALIEESLERSREGKTKADVVLRAVEDTVNVTTRVSARIEEVSHISGQQSRGVEEMARAIVLMQRVIQQTAAGAEQSASAAQQLNAQSEVIKDIMNRLELMVQGR